MKYTVSLEGRWSVLFSGKCILCHAMGPFQCCGVQYREYPEPLLPPIPIFLTSFLTEKKNFLTSFLSEKKKLSRGAPWAASPSLQFCRSWWEGNISKDAELTARVRQQAEGEALRGEAEGFLQSGQDPWVSKASRG